MVAQENEDGLLQQPQVSQVLEEAADPAVDKGDFAEVQGFDPGCLGLVVGEQVGEDEVLPLVVREIAAGVLAWRVPRLVGVEAVDPEEEGTVGGVLGQPGHRLAEDPGRGPVLL